MSPRFRRLWGAPIVHGILTAIGLVSALVGNGIWDFISAIALGIPVCTMAWYAFRRKPA